MIDVTDYRELIHPDDIGDESIKSVRQLQKIRYTIREYVEAGEVHIISISSRNKVSTSYDSNAIRVLAICCPNAPRYLRGWPAETDDR